MALSGLDSLQSLSDALEQYLLTRSPAAKKYHDSIDRSNRKTRDDPEREIIKKRIAGRRTEKAKWGAGCTTRYQSADEEFGHLRWERNETPHGCDSEPDEKEDDEQLRVLLGYVRPPEDDNYDDIPKLEYDEEDEEAEIYENYDSGNEGDDEDERLHKKGRWAVLCGMMDGLICTAGTSTGAATTDTTPSASNSNVLAPVQAISAPQDSGIPSSSLPPAISPVSGSALFSTGQNHDYTANQQSFPDDLNPQFGFIIARSGQAIPNHISSFPSMQNLAVPASATETSNTSIPTLPSMKTLPLPTSTTEVATHIPTFPPMEILSVPAFATEITNPITTFSTMENLPVSTSATETAYPISTFFSMGNPHLPTFTTDTGNHIPPFTSMVNLALPTFTTENPNPITTFPSTEDLPPPTVATEHSIIPNTSFTSSYTITSSENAPEPSAISITETTFNTSPSPVYLPIISINPSADAAKAQDPSSTTPALSNQPPQIPSMPTETPLTLTSTPLVTNATAATEFISTSTAAPRATSCNPNTQPIPCRLRIAPIRRPLTPDLHRHRVPKALTEEDKLPRGVLGIGGQEDDGENLSGKRKRRDQDAEMGEVNTRPVKKANAGMEEILQDVTKLDVVASRGNLKRVRWDDDVTDYQGARAPKRLSAGMEEVRQAVTNPDGVASRGGLKRVRWDEDVIVYEDIRAPKRANTGREETRRDVASGEETVSRGSLKKVRWDDNSKAYQASTGASKRLNSARKEGRGSEAVKLGRGILKRKREEEVDQEAGKNHIVRSMVDTRATKRPNLREEESWGLLKMVAKTVRSGWRFVVGLKNRIWR